MRERSCFIGKKEERKQEGDEVKKWKERELTNLEGQIAEDKRKADDEEEEAKQQEEMKRKPKESTARMEHLEDINEYQ